jgi:class 3 adenylate cyclase
MWDRAFVGLSSVGGEVLAHDKFYGKCGNKLDKALETGEKVPKTEGERKHVTVLFSDLSGYTAMSERLDPEEVKEITSRIFGEVSLVISKYEGFAKALFGVNVKFDASHIPYIVSQVIIKFFQNAN